MPSQISTLKDMGLRESVEHLFFPPGASDNQSVGLELEIWPFRNGSGDGNNLVRFYDDNNSGLIQILQAREGQILDLTWAPLPGDMPRFTIAGGQITFEPGGQLEYSGPPFKTINEAINNITSVIEALRCAFKAYDIWFFHSGLNPWHSVEEVGLQLQKDRYIHMNNFFKAIGPYGQRMMRLSTSLQVNLDVGDPETAQRRWLAANLLGPVFTAMFANSPFIEGKATGAASYRAVIWQNLDRSRTGFQPGFQTPTYKPCPVQQYGEFALDAYLMRLPDSKGNLVFDGQLKSFRQWMNEGNNGWFPTIEDWKTHLSTLFPEVRARGFFEIRYLDAQSKVWCSVPGILLTHLIYDTEAREEAIRLLEPYRTTLTPMLEVAAYKGMTDPELASLAKRIYSLGMKAAARSETSEVASLCEKFYTMYTYKGHSPACDLLRLNDGEVFTPSQYRDFEKKQVEAAGDLLQIICDYF